MAATAATRLKTIQEYLGPRAEHLLTFNTPKISRERLHLPGPDVVDRLYSDSDRNNRVLVSLQRMFRHGRLGGSGYLSILPVDQGVEHSAGASFAKNLITSTRKKLWNSPSTAAATLWLRHLEFWESLRENTLTKFRSS